MEKWLNKLGVFLVVIFGLLCVGAKIHFFTQYAKVGPAEYLEKHWPFWAGLAVVGAAGAFLTWFRERMRKQKSD